MLEVVSEASVALVGGAAVGLAVVGSVAVQVVLVAQVAARVAVQTPPDTPQSHGS